MYEAYWQLREKPFENTPDPHFIFYTQQHQEALARLLYVVRERKSAALLTGDFGCGKTLLSRVLWQELQQENRYQSIFILNPRLSDLEFIQEIVHQLSGEISSPNKIEMFHTLHKIFYSNYNAGKHTVLIVDESQAIQEKDIFEELRLLLNFQLANSFLLTIILLGQPELRHMVANLPQLSQRMAMHYHLRPFSEQETKEYIEYRLQVAQARKEIFEEDAYREIYFYSMGVPRRINNLCDLALLVAFGNGLAMIDRKTILNVGEDLESATENDLLKDTGKDFKDSEVRQQHPPLQ